MPKHHLRPFIFSLLLPILLAASNAGAETDAAKLREVYKKDCDSGSLKGCHMLGLLEIAQGREKDAIAPLEKFAESGVKDRRGSGSNTYSEVCGALGGIYFKQGRKLESFAYSQIACNRASLTITGGYISRRNPHCARLAQLPDYSSQVPMGTLRSDLSAKPLHPFIEPLVNPEAVNPPEGGRGLEDEEGWSYGVMSDKTLSLRVKGNTVTLTRTDGSGGLKYDEGARFQRTYAAGDTTAKLDFTVKSVITADGINFVDFGVSLTATKGSETATQALQFRTGG